MDVAPISNDSINQAIKVVQQGGVIAHATETCYGFACDLGNPEAVRKLFAIKQRPEDLPVSALFASIDQVKEYLEWNDLVEKLANEHLPGPLTIVLRFRLDAPHRLYSTCNLQLATQTIGMRISSHPTAVKLVGMFGSPLSTTSANVHGQANPYSAPDIMRQFEDRNDLPDLILDDGPLPVQEASTVIDVADGSIHVLRQGSLRIPKV